MEPNVTIFLAQLGIQVILALAALFLYRRVLPDYRPMLLFVIALLIISIMLSFFDLEGGFSKMMYSSHYVIEGVLIVWLAAKMKIFRRRWFLPAALAIIIGCWVVERFITGGFDGSVSWSRMVTYVVIALIGMAMLSRTLVNLPDKLRRSASFLFSLALVMYYGLGAVLELCLLKASNPSIPFMEFLFYTGVGLSIFTNLFYLKAILCAPKKFSYYTR